MRSVFRVGGGRHRSGAVVQTAGYLFAVAIGPGGNGRRCSGEQDEFPQQVGLRASEQLHLPNLDLVDGALHGAGVVGQGQPGGDGVEVAAEPVGERSQGRQVVIDGGHPHGDRVLVAGKVLDHPGEASHINDGGV